jgi:hypothetical protein
MPTLPVKTSGHVVLANRPGGVKCVIMLFNRRESGATVSATSFRPNVIRASSVLSTAFMEEEYCSYFKI